MIPIRRQGVVGSTGDAGDESKEEEYHHYTSCIKMEVTNLIGRGGMSVCMGSFYIQDTGEFVADWTIGGGWICINTFTRRIGCLAIM